MTKCWRLWLAICGEWSEHGVFPYVLNPCNGLSILVSRVELVLFSARVAHDDLNPTVFPEMGWRNALLLGGGAEQVKAEC